MKIHAPNKKQAQAGFTYLGIMLILALLSAGAALSVELTSSIMQRQNERELLAIGEEFNRAFTQYYNSAGHGQARWPSKLQDLLADPRTPAIVRHLRRIYINPLTGTNQWGTIPAPGGGIMGVFVIAQGSPKMRPKNSLPLIVQTSLNTSTQETTKRRLALTVMENETSKTKAESPELNSYAHWRFGFDPSAPATQTSPSPH